MHKVINFNAPYASMDCTVNDDNSAEVHITTNAVNVTRSFEHKNEAIDYALGMIPVLQTIR